MANIPTSKRGRPYCNFTICLPKRHSGSEATNPSANYDDPQRHLIVACFLGGVNDLIGN